MTRPATLFTLDDGTEITSRELSEKVNITQATARRRLEKSTDPAFVFRPRQEQYATPNHKTYELTNGRIMTARQIAEEAGLVVRNVSRRLAKGVRDYEVLTRPVDKKHGMAVKFGSQSSSKEIQRSIMSRNYHDELSRLALRVI